MSRSADYPEWAYQLGASAVEFPGVPEEFLKWQIVHRCVYRLAVPPSSNNLYRNTSPLVAAGPRAAVTSLDKKKATRPPRVKTAEYRAWIKSALLQLLAFHSGDLPQRLERSNYPCIECRCGVGYIRDVTNVTKPVEDLLVRAGIIKDDRYTHLSTSYRSATREEDGPVEWHGREIYLPRKREVVVELRWLDYLPDLPTDTL